MVQRKKTILGDGGDYIFLKDSEYDSRIFASKKILECFCQEEGFLYLGNLQLTTLPKLNMPNLEQLLLGDNQLQQLPQLDLPNLRRLDLNDNRLQSLPQLNLPNLRGLSLQNNQLQELPQLNLPNLEELILANNRLHELPQLNLPNLRGLSLQDNQLQELPQLNLPNLEELILANNQLHELLQLNLPNLEQLVLYNNPLQELPMSLANSSLVTIDIDDTQIPQSMVSQILNACEARRAAEAKQKLPSLLSLWNSYTGGDANQLQFISDFEETDQQAIYDWLIRLSLTEEFKGRQKELAKIVCEILSDLTHEEFKEFFLIQVKANNTRCRDRAAMALNEIYVSWRILVPKEGMTEQDKLSLLACTGKTLALRKILSRMPQMIGEQEGVQIYLYYETSLRERLDLLTAVQTMAYEELGKRDWIDIETLIEQVQEQYLAEAIVLPIFNSCFAKDAQAIEELEKIQEKFGLKLEKLAARLEKNELDEGKYEEACRKCMNNQEQACNRFKEKWLLSQLN